MSPDHLEHFRFRVLQDAMVEATTIYWRRRAEQFRSALPRPEDHIGRDVTPADRQRRRERILRLIEACDLRAQYAEHHGLGVSGELEVETALREAA